VLAFQSLALLRSLIISWLGPLAANVFAPLEEIPLQWDVGEWIVFCKDVFLST